MYRKVLDEMLSSQDAELVPTLLKSNDSKQLAAYADKLKADPRPWVREQIIRLADEIRRGLRVAVGRRCVAGRSARVATPQA